MSIGKGVCVLLMTLALFGLSTKVQAGNERELRQVLQGKVTVYQGTCHLTKDGKFAEAATRNYTVHKCIVGVDVNEPGEIYYVLIYAAGNQAVKLLKVNKDTKEQTVLWKMGSET